MDFSNLQDIVQLVDTGMIGLDHDPSRLQAAYTAFVLGNAASAAQAMLGGQNRPSEVVVGQLPSDAPGGVEQSITVNACLDLNGTRAMIAACNFGGDVAYVLAYRTANHPFRLADKALILLPDWFSDWDRLMLFTFAELLEPHVRLKD